MLHIFICDDEQSERTALQEKVVRWMQKNNRWDVSLRVYSSTEEVLNRFESGLPLDLLLLDIQIPGEMDGMTLARRIREKDPNLSIAFITNYDDYVFEGYTVSALRYLRKPVQEDALFECLNTAWHHHSLLTRESMILDLQKQRHVIRYSDLLYVESRIHHAEFHTSYSPQPITIRMRMEDCRQKLPSALFVQCHRSYIINIARICRLSSSCAVLSNGAEIPVSKTCQAAVRTSLENFYLQDGE